MFGGATYYFSRPATSIDFAFLISKKKKESKKKKKKVVCIPKGGGGGGNLILYNGCSLFSIAFVRVRRKKIRRTRKRRRKRRILGQCNCRRFS
jgi:hypothetical protein